MRALVDTSALLALARSNDQYHNEAVRIAERHLDSGGRFLGTTLILAELYSHLLYLRGAKSARVALQQLLEDPAHSWIAVDVGLVHAAAVNWLARFPDQSLSLVDAVSLEVMRRQRTKWAFAFDHHFEIVGYELVR